MEKINKKQVLGLWVIALLAVLFFIYPTMKNSGKDTNLLPLGNTPQEINTARIEIDFNNGSRRVFEGELKESYPLLLALESVAEEGSFQLKTQKDIIKQIAGVGGSWKIYKNGVPTNAPLNDLVVSGGDRYMLRSE